VSWHRVPIIGLVIGLDACTALWRWPEESKKAPPPETAAPAPAAPVLQEGQYVVKPGDTVYSIAFRHQIDFRDLAAWNNIGPDYSIGVGQVLTLRPPAGSASIRTYPAAPSHSVPPPAPVRRTPAAPVAPVPAGSWRWPTAGAVVKPFGEAKGVDIAGQLGQPVVAAAPGKVVYSGSALRGYGELVIIKHDEVYLSAYGYNRRRLVAEGEMVAAGQPIAELGLGPEQKPVLHFEVREKGRPVDPMGFLPKVGK
jgi:lipoprotein NlpD